MNEPQVGEWRLVIDKAQPVWRLVRGSEVLRTMLEAGDLLNSQAAALKAAEAEATYFADRLHNRDITVETLTTANTALREALARITSLSGKGVAIDNARNFARAALAAGSNRVE